jgi:hypothetical protein
MTTPDLWFIHIQGEMVGPLRSEVIILMLRQYRLHFADFIWREGLTNWTRISDTTEFASLLPPVPTIPVPAGAAPRFTALNTGNEKTRLRRYPRVIFEGRVEIEGHGEYDVTNVSAGGLFMRTEKPIVIGTSVRFRLKSSSFPRALEMTGIVVRHVKADEGEGFAVEFTDLDPGHKRTLDVYIKFKLIDKGPL